MSSFISGLNFAIPQENDPYAAAGISKPGEYVPSFTPGMLNTQGMDRYRQEALRTGPSAWARLARSSSAAQQENQRENALKQSQGQTAASLDDLAARGGLSSGARERAEQAGSKNYLSMSQDLTRQGNLNDLQLGVNDETNRITQLGQLPQMENQAIAPMVQENQRRNDYNMETYKALTNAQANAKMAQATENPGSNSSIFICTALRKRGLMNYRESIRMGAFMRKSLFDCAPFILWYFDKGQKAADIALKTGFDFTKIKNKFVDDILLADSFLGTELAQNMYMKATREFCEYILGMDTFKESFYSRNKLKSIFAISRLLLYPKSWAWLAKFSSFKMTTKFTRRQRA